MGIFHGELLVSGRVLKIVHTHGWKMKFRFEMVSFQVILLMAEIRLTPSKCMKLCR